MTQQVFVESADRFIPIRAIRAAKDVALNRSTVTSILLQLIGSKLRVLKNL